MGAHIRAASPGTHRQRHATTNEHTPGGVLVPGTGVGRPVMVTPGGTVMLKPLSPVEGVVPLLYRQHERRSQTSRRASRKAPQAHHQGPAARHAASSQALTAGRLLTG